MLFVLYDVSVNRICCSEVETSRTNIYYINQRLLVRVGLVRIVLAYGRFIQVRFSVFFGRNLGIGFHKRKSDLWGN